MIEQQAAQQEQDMINQGEQEVLGNIAASRGQDGSERLQGGPTAEQIRRQEMEENAPTTVN